MITIIIKNNEIKKGIKHLKNHFAHFLFDYFLLTKIHDSTTFSIIRLPSGALVTTSIEMEK